MQRPTTVTVFGILNILFACFGACQLGLIFAQPAIQEAMGAAAQENPLVEEMESDPSMKRVQQVSTVCLSLASLVQLVAGIGLLRMGSWARTLSICYAAYDILSKIVFASLNFMLLQGAVARAPELPAQLGPVAAFMGVVMGCGLIFGLIYPVLLLVFMFRKNVKAAFGPDPGAGDMLDMPDDNPDDNPYANTMS
jgi:hypothetical protein